MSSNKFKDSNTTGSTASENHEERLYDYAEFLKSPAVKLGISPAYQKRFISRCAMPEKRTDLWKQWIEPYLMLDDLNLHVPMHEDKTSNFSHHGSAHAVHLLNKDEPAQLAFSLFSNPILQPAFRYDDATWQRPKERCAVAPFFVFTFEADETPLQDQCDWIWLKDATGQTLLDKLDQHLAQHYRDYRGYTVVWSGNKSLHIHLLFASSHLSRRVTEILAERNGKNAEAQLRDHWQGDIDPSVIWDYYSTCWDNLESTIREATGIEGKFDQSLRYLHQKRRLPWGLRVAETGNAQGFKGGDLIPQVVLEERMRKTSAKGAQGYFLSATEANAMPVAQVSKSSSDRRCAPLYVDELLPALTAYLREGWGAEYPKPATITEETNGLTVWFYNSPADQNPSSFIEEDYRSMLWRGRDCPAGEKHKPLPDTSFTLGELLIELQAEIDAKNGNSIANRQRQGRKRFAPTTQLFANCLLSTAPKHYRSAMSILAWAASESFPRNMIVSAEGGGKTTAAIRDAGKFRLDDMLTNHFSGKGLVAPDNGFQVVCASSYKQAEEHYEAYLEWWRQQTDHASIDLPAPVLIRSFSEHYKRHCAQHKIDSISHAQALRMGFNSQVEAVASQQSAVFNALSELRDASWKVPGKNGNTICGFQYSTSVILFTSHDMAQNFNQPSVSKAWLHPDFDHTALQDSGQWRDLALQFRLYRVIHDEVSLNDLVDVASAKDVTTAEEFRQLVKVRSGADWSKVNQSQRYQIFSEHGSDASKALGFHELCRIIDIGFTLDDEVRVDFDANPFGINNSDDAMYRSTNGSTYYVKARNWWTTQRARVLFTTTEALVAQVAHRINKSDRTHWVPDIRVHRLDRDEFTTSDSIRLRRDRRASKANIDELVRDRLRGDKDFVITDMSSDHGSSVSTHVSARGRNDLQEANICTVLTFFAKDEYCRLNVIAQKFGIEDVYREFYRDRLNQAVGRNRGLRRNPDTPYDHEIVVSPTLYQCLGGADFFSSGRYPAYLVH
ncbi:hypothetical protein J7399_01985 [Shimia sp. R9_1]|uniref:hypothetical protein n=1 Tax=Shimia sp. R9_1 TaxID=2821111 RepID=UPI001ADC056F|nr:hypothetical protein [Shimia sp. R9_1]MBO9406182.1 hypothetical protein [Shimia sp. R9_1]